MGPVWRQLRSTVNLVLRQCATHGLAHLAANVSDVAYVAVNATKGINDELLANNAKHIANGGHDGPK